VKTSKLFKLLIKELLAPVYIALQPILLVKIGNVDSKRLLQQLRTSQWHCRLQQDFVSRFRHSADAPQREEVGNLAAFLRSCRVAR
jgi:hypothetical protein